MDRIGRYKIVRELGRGAMGVVYHAIDPNIGRPVAIKTIQLGGVRKPEEQDRLRERLFREARSAGILSHPGIVTIYDVEQQGDLAYIAMEYVDGPTLDQLLNEPQPLAGGRMFAILAQTAAALDYAHQKGIIHRDIKPANIMIAGDGTAKITDFGIAKITASEQFTMTGSIVGTPHYMSPEQVQGQAVDGRSDQFSLAVIAFEMLTGEKPYTGEHLTTVVYKIVAEEPVAAHRLNPSLSGSIESALRKALAKKPDARYRNCTEFVETLEKACAGTKSWKPLARGASASEPTLVESGKPAVTLPASRHPLRGGTTTIERKEKPKSNFLPFLLAVLMAAALLALIGIQAGPWNSGNHQAANNDETQQPPQNAQAQGSTAAQPAAQQAPPAGATGITGDTGKPSPMPPPQTEVSPPPVFQPPAVTAKADQPAAQPEQPAAQPEDVPRPVRKAEPEAPIPRTTAQPKVLPGGPQPVTVISSPGGATASLDGRADAECTTPCSLSASPGRHTVVVVMPGYQMERRQVDVGTGPIEMPAVILRMQSGTLMLSSTPPGATILVNGRVVTEVTPAQLSLAPGTYRITVQKNGLQSTSTVEIRNGVTQVLRVSLQ
jgi:serine/threonine-protein kinase